MSKESKRQAQIDQRIGQVMGQFNTITQELRNAIQREMELEEEVKAYHHALNDVLPLFTRYQGFDYNCVHAGLKALALHPELGITVSLSEKIHELGYDKEETPDA